MANSAKTCSICKYSVPKEAKVCAHCGASFITVTSKSFFGRILGGVKVGAGFGVLGMLVGAAFSGEAGIYILAPAFASIGALIGLFWGNSKEVSVLD